MKYELSEFVKMVAKHEGMVLEPYKDSLGISTIGIGRNLEDRGITDTELDYIGKTLEDILEEIVGEISDEFDPKDTNDIKQSKDGSYILEGSTTIRDINRANDWSLPDDEANTLAGLVIHEAQMIPTVGQVFSFHGYRFEVVERKANRITSIKVIPI